MGEHVAGFNHPANMLVDMVNKGLMRGKPVFRAVGGKHAFQLPNAVETNVRHSFTFTPFLSWVCGPIS
jgi:hypothetical protein